MRGGVLGCADRDVSPDDSRAREQCVWAGVGSGGSRGRRSGCFGALAASVVRVRVLQRAQVSSLACDDCAERGRRRGPSPAKSPSAPAHHNSVGSARRRLADPVCKRAPHRASRSRGGRDESSYRSAPCRHRPPRSGANPVRRGRCPHRSECRRRGESVPPGDRRTATTGRELRGGSVGALVASSRLSPTLTSRAGTPLRESNSRDELAVPIGRSPSAPARGYCQTTPSMLGSA